jgi:hypothetical protein
MGTLDDVCAADFMTLESRHETDSLTPAKAEDLFDRGPIDHWGWQARRGGEFGV